MSDESVSRSGRSQSVTSRGSDRSLPLARSDVRTSDSRLPTPDYIAYSGLIIDDIVLPDGRTFFNTLGGSGTTRSSECGSGPTAWDISRRWALTLVRIIVEQLERLGIDLRGLIERVDYPTARAWQLFETEARRVEVFRTDIESFYWYKAQFEEMPRLFRRTGLPSSLWDTRRDAELAEKLRAANPTACLVWEPTQPSSREPAMSSVPCFPSRPRITRS